jgi:hypothetical protein
VALNLIGQQVPSEAVFNRKSEYQKPPLPLASKAEMQLNFYDSDTTEKIRQLEIDK